MTTSMARNSQNAYTYLGEGAGVQVTDVNNDGRSARLMWIVVNAVLQLQADINPDANGTAR